LIACGIVVAAGYLAHLAGPLRLVDDGPLYLTGAADLASGFRYRDSRMPRGYPQALATLDCLGLNSSAGIVGLNLVCMALGLVLVSCVMRSELSLSRRECAVCALLCSLSWIWLYLAPVPMSDLLFFALSSGALAALSEAKRKSAMGAALLFAGAVVLSVAAFFVRTIGAALFASLVLFMLETAVHRRLVGRRTAITALLAGCAIAASIGIAGLNAVATSGYVRVWQENAFDRVNTPVWRVAEIGEVFQNVSARAFSSKSPTLPIESITTSEMLTREVRTIRYLSGSLAIGLILLGLFHLKRFSHTEAFLGAYVAILLVWPYPEVRFWVPVLPLLLGYSWIGVRSMAHNRPALTRATACYCVLFCLFGSVAMVNSLRASLVDRDRTWRQSHDWLAHRAEWLSGYRHFAQDREP
jgi:hypothetical protein